MRSLRWPKGLLWIQRTAVCYADPVWLGVAPLAIDGAEVLIIRYFLKHPDMEEGHLGSDRLGQRGTHTERLVGVRGKISWNE
jgi:hypothetical protein